MKIVQIENGFVHWDATRDVPDLDWAKTHYAPNIVFIEAPDYVFEGWTFDEEKEGDERFIEPIPPEGWLYDRGTGTFYPEDAEKPSNQSKLKTMVQSAIDQI